MAKTILIVDDNERIRRMVESRLDKLGYTILSASGGSVALEVLAGNPCDLVLMDQSMPGMDGLELFEHIKAEVTPPPPVIMMTAHGSVQLAMAFMKAGGMDFQEKPIDFDVLDLKIARTLAVEEQIRKALESRQAAERALQLANDELEQRVRERTAQLSTANNELRRAQKLEAIGKLAGGIAHDFNNILTAITGHADMLARCTPESDPRRCDIDGIRAAASRAADVTRQLLAYGRRQTMQLENIDLNAVISPMADMLRRLIGTHIRISLDLADTPVTALADRSQIEQVILNLALNGRDAMPAGGDLSIATGLVSLTKDDLRAHPDLEAGTYVEIQVCDSGHGMDQDTRDHIFEPFFTTKSEEKGTGLGLSTVYGIVRQCGGQISVSSSPNEGACFRIRLPFAEAKPETSAAETESENDPAGTECVLFVDDEETIRTLGLRYLALFGYRGLAAASGEEAEAIIDRGDHPIRLLITDLVMPGISGIELAGRVTAKHPQVGIIYMSGYSHNMLQNDDPNHRAAFLQKPFAAEALARKIRQVLDT